MQKKILGCFLFAFLSLILLCIIFYHQILIHLPVPIASEYKMTHDPKTRRWVEHHIGLKFPDSINWYRCYIDSGLDFTFNAKFSIPQDDLEKMLASHRDLIHEDFKHYINDKHNMQRTLYQVAYYQEALQETSSNGDVHLIPVEISEISDETRGGLRYVLLAMPHSQEIKELRDFEVYWRDPPSSFLSLLINHSVTLDDDRVMVYLYFANGF